MRTPITSVCRALAALWHRLDNEPLVRWLGSIAGATAVVQLLAAVDVLSADVATALTAFLVAAGVGAGKVVRDRVTGPVTASQMVRLPGTDPTGAHHGD